MSTADNEAADGAPQPPLPPPRPRRQRRPGAAAFTAQLAAAMPRPWLTCGVVAANALVFAVMVASGVSAFSPGAEELFSWGADFGPATARGEWWRLVTCTFLHFGVVHLAMNLWCLWAAAPLTERLLGHGAFAVVYLCSGIAGSLTSIAWHPMVVGAGASGAVFGTYGALLACALRLRGKVPASMFEHLRGSAGLFVLFNVLYGLRDPSIDHAAHAGGLLAGFAGAWLLCRAPADGTPRAPFARVDWRFAPVLAALLAVGVAAAVWRVDGSDAVRIEHAWAAMERADAAGRYEEALAHADAMLELAAAHAPLHGRRGLYLGNLGRHEDALRATDRAIALDPSAPTWHSNRAWSLAALSRPEEGVLAATRALALDPQLALARYNLLECLDRLGRTDEMLGAAVAAVAQEPGSAPAHAWHARALSLAQQHREALAAAERALAIQPDHAWALQLRARIAEQLAK